MPIIAAADDANLAGQIAPQRPVTKLWWFDASTSGTSSMSSGSENAMRPGAEVSLDVHAEEEGGVANSFLFSSLTLDGRARIGTGGQNPGAGASLSASSRVLQFRFMDREGTIYELLPVDVWASADYQAIPDLSSQRRFWRRPYNRQVLGASLSFGDMTGHGLDILRVGVETSKYSQSDETGDVRLEETSVDATFVTYNRVREDEQPDLQVDIVRFGATGIINYTGPDAVVGFVDLLKVGGLELYGGRVFADASGGFAGTGTMNISGSSGDNEWSTTINTENLPNTGTWTGSARVYGFLDRNWSAGLQADKDMYLTVDVELAIDSRLSAYAEWRNRHGALMLRAFASKNLLWLDKNTARSTTTGGAFASWHQPVGRSLSVITSVEVARSFYASLQSADGLRPDVATGANVFVTLAKHFGTDWRERRLTGM